MFLGATKSAVELIRKAFPDGCEELNKGWVLFFRFQSPVGEERWSLGLGAIEPEYVSADHSMSVAGLTLYFSVPEHYVAQFRQSVLHFNNSTQEFEFLEILKAEN